MLPNLMDCDFFKKATLFDGAKSEKAFIFKLKSEPNYTFMFTCPKCSSKNEFRGELNFKEEKVDKKKIKFIAFNCKKCNSEFTVEKFKTKPVKTKE
ncbi:MAG: hypothetical protein M1348_02735 [Candidatus Parvarchaeota archaeon]|nr:hypothetical protein [Candidatus Parvarchaeota archaeon]